VDQEDPFDTRLISILYSHVAEAACFVAPLLAMTLFSGVIASEAKQSL
jgi:hypothetical protein